MVTTDLIEKLGIPKPWEQLRTAPTSQHHAALQASSAALAAAIRDETVTIEDIDSFLREFPDTSPVLKDYLLSNKAWLLSIQGRLEEALSCYDEALKGDEAIPSTWALRGTVLLQLERIDEAFDAFEKAYLYRLNFGPQKAEYLADLLGVWSIAALLCGLSGILEQDVREAERGAFEYIELLNVAKKDNLQHLVLNLAVEQPVPQNLRDALEELELMVRLLSIEDPFDGWRALSKEMSKVWPEGLSVVKAVREMRR